MGAVLSRLLFLWLLLWAGYASAATPTLDASGTTVATGGAGTSGTVNITTSSTNDIIILFATLEKSGSTPPSVSSTPTATGLTFALLKAQSGTYTTACDNTTTCSGDVEIWWAFSSGTQSANTITVNFSASVFWILQTYGVNGQFSNTTPFDSNAGLPAGNNSTSFTVSPAVTLSTSQAHDLIMGWGVFMHNSTSAACDTNWTAITSTKSSSSDFGNFFWVLSQSNAVSVTQSGITVHTGATGNCAIVGPGSMIGAAVTGDNPATCPLTRTRMGVGC